MEFTFHLSLGVDLDAVRGTRSWRWFMTRLRGLLQTDTPLARHFMPPPTPPQEDHDGR